MGGAAAAKLAWEMAWEKEEFGRMMKRILAAPTKKIKDSPQCACDRGNPTAKHVLLMPSV